MDTKQRKGREGRGSSAWPERLLGRRYVEYYPAYHVKLCVFSANSTVQYLCDWHCRQGSVAHCVCYLDSSWSETVCRCSTSRVGRQNECLHFQRTPGIIWIVKGTLARKNAHVFFGLILQRVINTKYFQYASSQNYLRQKSCKRVV